MANKVYNLNGGLYSGDAFTAFETRIASSNNGSIVASPSDLKVSAGSGMNVTVSTGAGIIGNGTLSGVRFAIDSPVTVAVSAASTANPRMDSVVVYIDKSVSASTSVVDNTDLGIVKFKSVAGTPASAPTAPSTATIQSSIGAGNPYMILANVTVPKSSTAASSFKIADMRVTPTSAIITDNSITTPKLANKSVTSAKVDFTTFKFPIPDYSKGTSISNSTNTWKAPKCGVVVAVLVADTTNGYKEAKISVNNQTVASALWAGVTGGYNFQTRAIVPVATGDVVKFSATDGESKVDGRVFYPYKWAA